MEWLPIVYYHMSFDRSYDAHGDIEDMAMSFAGKTFPPIKMETIVETMNKLLEHLALGYLEDFSTAKRMRRMMRRHLDDDLSLPSAVGIRLSRHKYLVFCLLAQLARSEALAECMVKFLRSHIHKVVGDEDSRFFGEWCMGTLCLEDSIARPILKELSHHFLVFKDPAHDLRSQVRLGDPRAGTLVQSFMGDRERSYLGALPDWTPAMLGGQPVPPLALSGHLHHPRRHRDFQIAYPGFPSYVPRSPILPRGLLQ